MLTNTILDTFFGITSLILKPFSLRLIWPELHHLHSLFSLFQLIFFSYFFTRYISWPLDKNTSPPPPSLPFVSAISMLEAILDLANLPTFKSTSVEVSLTGMAMWLSFLFVHRSFGSFETWFLFHKQQTKNTKNHSLPIIVKIMATLLIAAFVNGQLWLLLSALDGNESSISAPPGVLNGGFFLKFTTLMYFGITSAISGEIPSIAGVELFATTPSHFLWASIITFSSIGLYAASVGQLFAIINNSQETHQTFVNSMTTMEKELDKHNVPTSVIVRARRYYELLMRKGEESDQREDAFARLPLHMRREIKTHMSMATVFKTVKSFNEVSDSFLVSLCEFAELEYALQGDNIMWQGDIGDCMYILKSGVVDVIVSDSTICQLHVGDVIGEFALLSNEKRSATIRASEPVQLLRLMRDDFSNVCDNFPLDHAKILQFSSLRLQDNERRSLAKKRLSGLDADAVETANESLKDEEAPIEDKRQLLAEKKLYQKSSRLLNFNLKTQVKN